MVRWLLSRWSPVGSGVKSDADIARLTQCVFPQGALDVVAPKMDKRISKLPGLEHTRIYQRLWSRVKDVPFQRSFARAAA